jgi:predicted nucleotidyltransferase
MNLDWLAPNTIFLTLHGSQAYGLNNDLSDVDVKGICVPPRVVEDHLFHRFEQAENNPKVEEKYGKWKNPLNPKFESVIYSLKKFFTLASKVNPNIIELLYTDEITWLEQSALSSKLISKRDMFLSTKAKFTFSGYAMAQAKKIERHRKWIVQGELTVPNREEFGLPPVMSNGVDEIFSYIKAKVEQWNFNQFTLEESSRSDMKEMIWELLAELCNKEVSWDNWPDAYAAAAIHKMESELNLREEVIALINAERAYFKAKKNYESWLRWKSERNPARRELEVKSGYDTKHASHLVRIMRMGYEIMTQGKVIVKRPDAAELLDIKNGGWSYDRVMEYSEELRSDLDDVYKSMEADRKVGKPVLLPREVDFDAVNNLYHRLSEDYLSDQGR